MDDRRTRAESLFSAAASDPAAAEAAAHGLIAEAAAAGDHASAAFAGRALGLSLRFQLRLDEARSVLETAAEDAEAFDDERLIALIRVTKAAVAVVRGDVQGALAELDLAEPFLRGTDRVQLLVNRAFALGLSDRNAASLPILTEALRLSRAAKDHLMVARVLQTRSVRTYMLGDIASALKAGLGAVVAYQAAGNSAGVAMCRFNVAVFQLLRGEIPQALRTFDEADRDLEAAGINHALGNAGRIDGLLRARLYVEALESTSSHQEDQAAGTAFEGHLLLVRAQALGGLGRFDEAVQVAARAEAALDRQQRPSAHLVQLFRLQLAARGHSAGEVGTAAELATRFAELGWERPRHEAQILAAEEAVRTGDIEAAVDHLVSAALARNSPVISTQLLGWTAAARGEELRGNAAAAQATAHAGLEALRHHQLALVATELRIAASGHGEALTAIGLRAALATANPESIWSWAVAAQSVVAASLAPQAPPKYLNRPLSALRALSQQIDELSRDGRDVTPLLLDRRIELERQLARADLRRPDRQGRTRVRGVPTLKRFQAALGATVMVHYLEVGKCLHVAVVTSDGVAIAAIGEVKETTASLNRLRTLLGAVLRGRSTKLHRIAIETAQAELRDQLLLGPLKAADPSVDPSQTNVVVVPTRSLYRMPWGAIASSFESLTVAASAQLWYDARRPIRSGGTRVVLIEGPGLKHARSEIAAIAECWGSAQHFARGVAPTSASPGNLSVLSGERASVDGVLAALGESDIAHFACHGRLRFDNPRFSSLVCADGPLTVRDIETLPTLPMTVVLAACDAASGIELSGAEVLGLSVVLTGRGVRNVIAPVLAISDEWSTSVMCSLHSRLACGERPARALAELQRNLTWEKSPIEAAMAASLVCTGTGT